MSWFGGLNNILGSTNDEVNVQQLVQRFPEANLLEERKKIVQQLKEASPDQNKIAGQCIPFLIKILKTDREDLEIVRDSLQVLLQIITIRGREGPKGSAEYENAQLLMKTEANVISILEVTEERDASIRYHSCQILRILVAHKTIDESLSELQQIILVAPMGIAKLMDLLKETREIVRNEALLLLLDLTPGNQEIQKIVAFEGAFEIALDIIYDEGLANGGIITQDCLHLINNLLRNNISNQNYFRETNCFKRLPKLLELSNSDMWILTDDQIQMILLSLQLISLLISGNNPSTSTNQDLLAKYNIIQLLLPLALGGMQNIDIRIQSLATLGDMLYANKDNCSQFSVLTIQHPDYSLPQPVLNRVLQVVMQSTSLRERLVGLRLFKLYFFENEEGQLAVASTLTPPPTSSVDGLSLGTQLINALLGWEQSDEILPYRSWFASHILSFILKDSSAAKQLILKIPLDLPKSGVPMVTLLTKCLRSLTLACGMTTTSQTTMVKVGFLKLLITWFNDCGPAVKAFLMSPQSLPLLVEIVLGPSNHHGPHAQGLAALIIGVCFLLNDDDNTSQFSKSALQSIILQRIGVDQEFAKLDALRRTTDFIKAEQGKEDIIEEGHLNYYDGDFAHVFKTLFDSVQRQLKSPNKIKGDKIISTPPITYRPGGVEHNEAIIASYKELIRQQDAQVEALKMRNIELEHLLRSEKESSTTDKENYLNSAEIQAPVEQKDDEVVCGLKLEITSLKEELETLQQLPKQLESLSNAYNSLEQMVLDKDSEITNLKLQIQQFNEERAQVQLPIQSQHITADNTEELNNLRKEIEELKNVVSSLTTDKLVLSKQLEETKQSLTEQQTAYVSLEKEQEELLLALANQEIENNNLQARLSLFEDEQTQ